MTWLTNLATRFRGVWRQEYRRYGDPGLSRYLPEGLRLTREQQISVSAAYGCVRAIVDPIAASDWEVFVRGKGGARENQPDGTAFYVLNVRANRNLPAIAAKELILTHALTRGDGYGLILRDGSDRAIGWDILDPDRMSKGWQNDPAIVGGGRLVYIYSAEDGETWEISDTEVIHLRGPSVRDLFGGDSVLGRAAVAIATAAAQEKFGNVYFANGAHLGGYIKLKGKLKNQSDVDRLKADWSAKTAGLDKVGETAVLEDGAEFHDLTPDAERVQLVAPRAFQVEDIARYFGVPLVKLMVKEAATGYGANLSTLNEQFSRDTLTPHGKRAAQEFGYKLLPQRAPWPEIEVNLKWTTRGDAESRARVRQMDVQNGVITRDEARAEEGYTALPGGLGSLVTVTTGTALLKEAVRPKPVPVLPPPRPERDDEEIERQRQRADAAEGERDAFKNKTDELRGLLAASETKLGQSQADLAATRKEIANVAEERDEAGRSLAASESRADALAADVERVTAKAGDLEKSLAAAQSETGTLRSDLDASRAREAEVASQVASLRAEAERLTARAAEVEASAKDRLGKLDADLMAERARATRAEVERTDALAQVEVLRASADRATAALDEAKKAAQRREGELTSEVAAHAERAQRAEALEAEARAAADARARRIEEQDAELRAREDARGAASLEAERLSARLAEVDALHLAAQAEAERLGTALAAANDAGASARSESALLARAGVALALSNHARRWRGRQRDVSPEALEASREDMRALFASDLGDFGRHVSAEQFTTLAAQVEVGYEPAKAIAFVFDRRVA
jgi:HK97 family phage portal protein